MAGASWIRGKLLGAGAFGSVSLAMQREDGAVFAAKSVTVEANSEVAVRAIENEIGLLQALDSKYVVRCLGSDWTEENGQTMRNVFLEYMPEGCLTDFLNQFARAGALDEHLIRTYTRSIVEGIEYLHDHDVVHCDVKGKNILVGNGHVKLTDFGSAKRVAEDGSCSKARGTPLWMAPEVVRQVEQGPASDIWSLGCTVVEMATGRAPWRNLAGMNQFAALYHIGCTDDLPPVPAWLSPDAHDFLAHCFQRDPRQRWTSTQLLHHPFLTTRFTPAPEPKSPTSVTQFPDDDCDVHFSVPTLAAPPSLLKRNPVSAAPARLRQVQSEPQNCCPNWWSSPACSGPWIVVRSPPASPKSSVTLSECIKPISSSYTPLCQCEDPEIICVENTPLMSIDADSSVVAATSNGDNYSSIFISVATAMGFGCCVLDLDCVQVKLEDNPRPENCQVDRELLVEFATRLGLVSGKMCTCSEYSVVVNQCCNPQILLYWWHCRKRRLRSDFRNCSSCGIQLQSEYTFALNCQMTPASLEIVSLSMQPCVLSCDKCVPLQRLVSSVVSREFC